MRWAITLLVCLLGQAASAQLYGGVNLAGAEFGESQLPGTYGTHYTYPTPAEIDYYADAGMNLFRIPFRWERLQRSLSAPLDGTESARLQSIVAYATGLGAHVILDPHNYARYHGALIGSASVPNAAFADFWSRVAALFAANPRVIFGLMNEPHTMPTEQWVAAANAAIAAIRAAGAQNLILVPGNAWTGAHSWSDSWYGTPNAVAMQEIADPAQHFAFEVHQYLDADSSGTSATIVSPTIGSQRLAGFTSWLRAHGYRGLLGEFAVARQSIGTGPAQIGDEALTDMLGFVAANDDVWLGWAWWAGGPWWGEYMFTLEPQNLGEPNETDRPQLAVLQPYLLPEPASPWWPAVALLALLHRVRDRRSRDLRTPNRSFVHARNGDRGSSYLRASPRSAQRREESVACSLHAMARLFDEVRFLKNPTPLLEFLMRFRERERQNAGERPMPALRSVERALGLVRAQRRILREDGAVRQVIAREHEAIDRPRSLRVR